MRRFNASHHRPFDSLPASEVPVPNRPLERVRDDALRIHGIAKAVAEDEAMPATVREVAVKLVLLSRDMSPRIEAVERLIECHESDVREMRNEGLAMAQETTALRARVAELEAALNTDGPARLSIPLTREPHRAASGE